MGEQFRVGDVVVNKERERENPKNKVWPILYPIAMLTRSLLPEGIPRIVCR